LTEAIGPGEWARRWRGWVDVWERSGVVSFAVGIE
jgi:hypothetical protein